MFRGKKRKNKNKNKKRQQGKGFPIGLLASAAAPLLGKIAKPIFKKNFGKEEEDDEGENTAAMMSNSKKN